MLELATHEREITMVSDQIGAPTSVRFLAEATAQLLAQSAGDTSALFASRGGTLHVACAGETSWFAFAEEIFLQVKQLGLPLASPLLRSVRSDDRPGALPRPLNSRLDTTRLRDRFGVAPPFWDVEFRALFPSLFARYELEMREANNSAQASLR
jgi:dTDP-4-dehydrorhamnose reductase